ncbi:MAG: hypothetical protein DYG92_02620 [Leptolyngbya sp. PLA1]|nr:hypothetical protein [Leptolyngbya sp. PLA1]
MELTKRQRLCVLVLSLSGGALLIDKVLLGGGGPSPAEASTPANPQSPAAEVPAPAPTPVHAVPQTPTLESRLASVVQPGEEATRFSAAFMPPAEWLPAAVKAEPVVAEVKPMPAIKVTMVVTGEGKSSARINDQLMAVGDTMGEITLIAVERDGVVVEVRGERRRVRMAGDTPRTGQ